MEADIWKHGFRKQWLDNSTLKPNRLGGIGSWPLIVTEPLANDCHWVVDRESVSKTGTQ